MIPSPHRVVVVDYGAGNLLSVRRAIEHVGGEADITSDPSAIMAAERLILPGVGAFGDGMAALHARGLVEPLRTYARSGRALLGICLGMQMLLERGLEFGEHEGLGLITGEVRPISATGADGRSHKIPHIGWNSITAGRASWSGTPLETLPKRPAFYFVHSYEAVPTEETDRLATVDYDGLALTAAVCRKNVIGTQFHPEKSGELGLEFIRNFLSQ